MAGLLAMAQLGAAPMNPAPENGPAKLNLENNGQSVAVVELSLADSQVKVHAVAPAPSPVELIASFSRAYGVDADLALAIARCESRLRHYDADGSVLRGEKNRYDVGIFQINEQYHLAKSRELGLDIYTSAGNIEYAIWLMGAYGRAPWVWSWACWGPKA